MTALEPLAPLIRYERKLPGELVHIDIEKLGRIGRVGHRIHGDRRQRARGVGWEYLNVCIDDASRVDYAEMLDDERKETVTGFVKRAIRWFEDHGVGIRRIMTDDGSGYRSKLLRRTLEADGIRHRFTRPYGQSDERTAVMSAFLSYYNYGGPGTLVGGRTAPRSTSHRGSWSTPRFGARCIPGRRTRSSGSRGHRTRSCHPHASASCSSGSAN